MTDNFAEGLIARLQQCLAEQPQTSQDNRQSIPETHAHAPTAALLDTSAQHKGLSLLELQSCLRGRKGDLPHIGELGAAMRRSLLRH